MDPVEARLLTLHESPHVTLVRPALYGAPGDPAIRYKTCVGAGMIGSATNDKQQLDAVESAIRGPMVKEAVGKSQRAGAPARLVRELHDCTREAGA